MSETTGHSPLPTILEVRREILDKLRTYAAASSSPIPLQRAIVEQQCLDFLSEMFSAASRTVPSSALVQAYIRHYGGPFVTSGILEAVRWSFEDGPSNRVRIRLMAQVAEDREAQASDSAPLVSDGENQETSRIAALLSTHDALRDALQQYGRHKWDCPYPAATMATYPDAACTCGFSALLRALLPSQTNEPAR